MAQFLQHIRTHFNIIHKGDYLGLTLINPNLTLDLIHDIRDHFRLMSHIKRQEIVIIESVNFDDELLIALANSLPSSLEELTLDFTGCESLKGSGFLDLFERISSMEGLRKLKLDLSEVYDINDIVMEGISMLLESLGSLKEFYLDLYEIDQVTEDGYLLLAEAISHLQQAESIHLDLSANPNLTEDCLQLLFANLPPQLTSFSFRIIDIEHIGGGSFFKLSEWLSNRRCTLKSLSLTISSFAHIDQKSIFSLLKAISSCDQIEKLSLNLSNINLPDKMLSHLALARTLREFNLDVSCNSLVGDRDIISLCSKLPVKDKLESASFNFDFCKKISEDCIEQLLEVLFSCPTLMKLGLPDRHYSEQFVQNTIEALQKSACSETMLLLSINGEESKPFQKWQEYKRRESQRRKLIIGSHLILQNKTFAPQHENLLQFLVHPPKSVRD